jgi:ABC-type transport system involved in cytochrome bd biosynthesis fused ATPase/permease subunit
VKSADLRLLLTRGGSRSLFVVIAIASAVWTLIIVLNALLLTSIIVNLIESKNGVTDKIAQLAILWIFRSIFHNGFENWCSYKASKIKNEFRSQITTHVGSYKTFSPAHLTSLLVKGLNSLDIYIGRFIPQMVFAITTPIAVLMVMARLDVLSSVIAILTLPLIPIFGALIGKYTNESVNNKWQSLGTLSRYFEDSLRGFVTLRIFGRDKTQGQRIAHMGDKYTDETMKVLKISFLSALVLELCATISVALIAVSVGIRLVDGKIDFYNALAVLILAPEVYFPLRSAASLFHASADGTAVLRQIEEIVSSANQEVVEEDIEIQNLLRLTWSKWKLDIPGVMKSSIPGHQLAGGEVVGIIGESGIGKSSFAENLLGHEFTTKVRINDIFELTPERAKSWQKKIGWIPQNPQLFAGTIRDQFTILEKEISDQEIWNCLGEVSLVPGDLPKGLDTKIGSGGEKSEELSGGQLRKVAIARAIFRNPLLIVADEPSADLDLESATKVMQSLRRRVALGSALIVITHDRSILNSSDQILEATRSYE